jgi:hypothetical protein
MTAAVPSDQRLPLYRRILGDAYARLPPPLQAMHDVQQEVTVTGVAAVERGHGLLSRLVAWLFGFPPAGKDVPVSVTFRPHDGREEWHRNFAGRKFMCVQEEGRGRDQWLLCERFGPLAAAMALVLDEGRLRLVLRHWSAFGLPLPMALAPRINAYEFAEAGRFDFHVEIAHPVTGPIVGYRGWLDPH